MQLHRRFHPAMGVLLLTFIVFFASPFASMAQSGTGSTGTSTRPEPLNVKKFEQPSQGQETNVVLAPADRAISGVIAATTDNKVSVAEGDIVYLDQGEQQGVRVGDRFNVLHEVTIVQHPITRQPVRLPRRPRLTVAVFRFRSAHFAFRMTNGRRRAI